MNQNNTPTAPGPWHFDPTSGAIRNQAGDVLATVPHAIAGDDQDQANGQLMARAPELRDALAQLVTRATEALNRLDPDSAGLWHAMTQEARAALDG